MYKKCVNCGAELSQNAAFCPHCETIQIAKQPVKQPRLWRKKALIATAVITAALLTLLPCLYHRSEAYEEDAGTVDTDTDGDSAETIHAITNSVSRPDHAPDTHEDIPETIDTITDSASRPNQALHVNEDSAETTYIDTDGTYHLFLCFDTSNIAKKQKQGSVTIKASAETESAKPSQLSVYDEETGADAQDTFFEEVDSCTVETIPGENSKAMECSQPAKDHVFPNAARVAHVYFNGDSGTNEIRWTLNMKNGDTIILSQFICITRLETLRFFHEVYPMDTLEQLQELLATIEDEISPDTVVDLYLPPVIYDGGLTLYKRAVNLHGSTDGENQTTFTGTLTIESEKPEHTYITGIRFAGNGGTGLLATAAIELSDCEFVGWDLGAVAHDGAWITPWNCVFANNKIGLHFNSSHSHRTSPAFGNNTFTGNGTAVLFSVIPGDLPIDFCDSVFSRNETDINNLTSCKIDATNSIFD